MITRPLLFLALLITITPSRAEKPLLIEPVADPIPVLHTKGDVYKTEGPNDPLIYGSTVGEKKMIMLYTDFSDLKVENKTTEVGETVLGKGRFLDLFHTQSYGNVKISIDHVHGWRHLPKPMKEYDARTTEAHREMFVDVFALYPETDFRKYDYIVAKMPGRGNFAFGERDDLAIPYRGGKIKVAVNIGSNSPFVLAHEVAHLMGLPDLYTLGKVEGPKNPVGSWDLMSSGHHSAGFIGWHRHKLGWLAPDRKAYLTENSHAMTLTPLDAAAGISMIVIPADDPKKPSKVFVVEVGQVPAVKEGQTPWPTGVLIYSVDATRATGKHPVVIYPKADFKEGAPFLPGDTFEHEDAPFHMTIAKKASNGSYQLLLEIKK